jgi:Tc toxin complex TcA C-terminal TcB-binding domain
VADFIVLRLTPAAPIDATTFASYLNGLTVSVYDVSFAHPSAGTPGDPTPAIGAATFNAPAFATLPVSVPPPPIVNYPAGTTIAQHFTAQILLGDVVAIDMQSVATAVIPYVAPAAEYPAAAPRPDLRIQFQRAGGKTILDPDLYYDVALYSAGGLPSPDQYQEIADSSVSAYVTLPAALDPTLAGIDLPADGSIPNYDDLIAAINTVLAADPGGGVTLANLVAATPLTANQCSHIANEIVWGAEPPLPTPPEGVENMYTNPPNDGGLTNANEQDRQQFEGQLSSYYATRAAKVERLTKYIYAAAAAIWCEQKSATATQAVISFPVNPAPTSMATVKEAEVILAGALGVEIPAQYFYALGAMLPTEIKPEARLRMATGADQQQNLTQLTSDYDRGVFSVPPSAPQPPVNPAQAVRLLSALFVSAGSSAPSCPIAAAAAVWADFKSYPPTAPPTDAWRTYKPGDDEAQFWPAEQASAAAGVQTGLLNLDLCALTQGYVIANSAPPVALADFILQHLVVHSPAGTVLFNPPVTTVAGLAQALASDWRDLFDNAPLPAGAGRNDLLPPFTAPGTFDTRVEAFVRYARKFFDLPSAGAAAINPPTGAPTTLPLPTDIDPIESFVLAYQALAGGVFAFGGALVQATVEAAAAAVFPTDPAARQWLIDTVEALNDLCALASVPGAAVLNVSLPFSVAEALYARGFTRAHDVLALTPADFKDALRGSVAYDQASAIYAKALAMGPAAPPPAGPGGAFGPVNPGTLTNCIPPCHLSPLGPVQYLHELLQLSEASTCEHPFAAPAAGHLSLGDALAARRGQLGALHATEANNAVPLPLIDIVNECLEAMCATLPVTTHGLVYDTAEDALAGLELCHDDDCCHDESERDGDQDDCHEPATLFAALPEHSTPAIPDGAVERAAFNALKSDVSSCCLPYSQPLDVVRTYLREACTSRFETMRTFRRCITEFALAPEKEPAGFQDHLWRYPVRIDIAIEYLCITPEEFVQVFGGHWPAACGREREPPGEGGDHPRPPDGGGQGPVVAPGRLFNFTPAAGEGGVRLPAFLQATCLTYCEFVELWKSRFVIFRNGADQRLGVFPDCEPCCLDDLWIGFPEGADTEHAFQELFVFIRLWGKLRGGCGKGYSFVELADICQVLQLFTGGVVNPDFIRQLAAFQMLRDDFALKLADHRDPPPAAAAGADRTHLLALWVGPAAAKWGWAVEQLLHGVQHHARRRFGCERPPELIKLLRDNLDPLSALAGFDPATAADTWHTLPTHTLRFAEVLAKIASSNFGVGEILFLFTADAHIDGDDRFPLQPDNEALDRPLGLPDDEEDFSLWRLRRKLLEVHVDEKEAEAWDWPRVAHALQRLGFAHVDVTALAEHFFPDVAGHPVPPANRHFATALAAADTAPLMWNSPPQTPLRYDAASQTLWTELPLKDEAVIGQLSHLRPLNAQERQAVQNLYFAPRQMLAAFAMLFDDFAVAQHQLIERGEHHRWVWFQRQFACFHRRAHVIVDHLSAHVRAATGQEHPQGAEAAMLVLHRLLADENLAVAPWEDDGGHAPAVTWAQPAGGALAALLGLTGTGLVAEYGPIGGPPIWRDVCGALSAFGGERNQRNCPAPAIVPSLQATLPDHELAFVNVLNGLALRDTDGEALGGAEGFAVTWTGALLVEEPGTYEFCAGGPTEDGERPHQEHCEHQRWRVILKRGQQTWFLLKHGWKEDGREPLSAVPLKRGAYEIRIEFVQYRPEIRRAEDARALRTGFELKYAGPDTEDRLIAVPHHRLFALSKSGTLGAGLAGLAGAPAGYLSAYYTSSLRDVRRTYQRAFKALLYAHRFALSAEHWADRRSELSYMLDQKSLFAGRSFYPSGGAFATHAADFDFNLLPLLDDYLAPNAATDGRVQPSLKRKQALFDWWERTFDYARARRDVEHETGRRLWLLFDEAAAKHPAHPNYLLRHMGADSRHWSADLHYFQSQGSPIYSVTYQDLEDDRWVVRAWHSDRWMRRLRRDLCVKDIRDARPDLWASDDPAGVVPGVGPDGKPNPAGCANLLHFLIESLLANNTPRRYEDLKRLNDCLRERGRDALLAYLCAANRVALPWGGFARTPNDLSNLLLLDVEAGIRERASRIEEAICAVQTFVRRARLGIDPGWSVSHAFAQLWDRRFATFEVWEACKCREVYKENWIDWEAQKASQKVESFRFLQSELRRSTLTAALPGGLEYWPGERPVAHPSLLLLQDRDPSALKVLEPAREGLGLLGTPERAARPSWLAPLAGSQPPDGRGAVAVHNNAAPGAGAPAAAAPPPSGAGGSPLPLWVEAAIRLGVRFWRIAAGGTAAAAGHFRPRHFDGLPGCCSECGEVHPPQVDEYYFWLLDARFYRAVDQSDSASFFNFQQDDYYDTTTQDATPWHDPLQLPGLLDWHSQPMVRLAWCRVHNGEFKQPRRSTEGVQVDPKATAAPDLTFLGRMADSLVFQVTGGVRPTGYKGADQPGFRYDLAPDETVTLPLVADPPVPANPYPAGLPAYPFFAYAEPGAPLFPGPLFSPALAVACALRTRCRYEAALKWYALIFDPLHSDDTWMLCEKHPSQPGQIPGVQGRGPVEEAPALRGSACCDTTDVTDTVALNRSVLLHYLETLLEWSDALMRRASPEAFQQSRMVLDTAARILGPTPVSVDAQPPAAPQTVSGFSALYPPLNPRLLDIYGRVQDRLALIRHGLNAHRLRDGRPGRDLPFWGKGACCGCHTLARACADGCRCECHEDECQLQSPYRFVFLLQKAQELAGLVREFGGTLLAAFEKGDAEYLASLRAGQELEVSNLGRAVRQDQWRDADWQRQALQTSKEVAQTNRRYYATLIQNGLNSGEHQYQDLTAVSLASHVAANIIDGVAEAMDVIPDLFVGFPCEETWLPLGTKLAGMFKTIARVTHAVGDMTAQTAGLDLTQSGWARRLQEWVHQVEVLDLEIQQIERQILAAERRQDVALRELNTQQRTIENAKGVLDFLRDKFTSHELYLHLQKEIAAFHYKAWELARHAAEQAERAFNFERGNTARRFLPFEPWDNLHEGLLAGERLQLALRAMEQAYLDLNLREYEISKHFSLRLHFPIQFLQLKTSGVCEIELPEWMFDLDHPGQFMRRIRNVTLTIPTVTGPYTGVHARLTLLSSRLRVDPRLSRPPHACCDTCGCENDYEPCSCDPRFVKHFGAREAIATSGGQNDGGLFELNFRDERYLPFEFFGAVSRWRLELPPENNFFDFDALSDVVLNLNYTAREGGDLLRRAANEVAQCRVRRGWSLFDVRHEFADAFQHFRSSQRNREGERRLGLRLTRRMFPYIPCQRELVITRLALLFETQESREQACCRGEFACCGEGRHDARPCRCGGEHKRHCEAYGCGDCQAACCCECIRACQVVQVTASGDDDCDCDAVDLRCAASEDYPGLYYGTMEIRLGPLDECRRTEVTFEFPATAHAVSRVYLMCHYEAPPQPCEGRFVARPFETAGHPHDDRDRRP